MHERESISNEAENNDKSSISTTIWMVDGDFMSMVISKRKEANTGPATIRFFDIWLNGFEFSTIFLSSEGKGNSIEANCFYPFSFLAFKFIQIKSKNNRMTATVNAKLLALI